jgi:predicted nucleic acid-binding Zn ribbon protein
MAAVGAMRPTSEQRRRVRRSALLWALIAAAFYLGFIILMLLRGHRR